MGGYVNLAVRKEGKTQIALSDTSAIWELFNPDVYLGEQGAIDGLLSIVGPDDRNTSSPRAGILAPYDYGLIVVDFDSKTVLDMQSAEWIKMCTMFLPGPKGKYVRRLGKMGWLGTSLFSSLTGKQLGDIPEGIFEDEARLNAWIREEVVKEMSNDIARDQPPSLSDDAMVAFCIQPPGWKFKAFDPSKNAEGLRDALKKLDFTFTPFENTVWDEWIVERNRERNEGVSAAS